MSIEWKFGECESSERSDGPRPHDQPSDVEDSSLESISAGIERQGNQGARLHAAVGMSGADFARSTTLHSGALHPALEVVVTPSRDINHSELHLPPLSMRLIRCTCFLLLVISPLLFGATYAPVYLTLTGLVSIVCLVVLSQSTDALAVRVSLLGEVPRAMAATVAALAALVGYLIVTFAVRQVLPVAHPVLGMVPLTGRPAEYLNQLLVPASFLTVFFLVSILGWTSQRRLSQLRYAVIHAGVLMSLVGLAHWFYDNGLLFWVFRPDYVAAMDRVRWPLVNPDHFAAYLLPVAFLLISEIETRAGAVRDLLEDIAGRKFLDIVSSRPFQRQVSGLGFYFLGLVTVVLAIAGSLSRGAWLAAGVGLLVYLAATLSRGRAAANREGDQPASFVPPPAEQAVRQRRRSSRRPAPRWGIRAVRQGLALTRPLFALLALTAFAFFVGERGSQLIAARLDYALAYSLEDIRWTMYGDTLPMLRDNLLFGVGLGRWEPVFGAYRSDGLAGLYLKYLHSDVLQFFTEVGLVGFLPLMLLFGYLFARFFVLQRALLAAGEAGYRLRLAGLAAGLVAFLVASCFDFPWRVPAVAWHIAILLGIFCAYLDRFAAVPGRESAVERSG